MLTAARRSSDRLKWALRGLGAGLMWWGCGLTLSFVPALAASRMP